jgi:hypothetical protein
LRSVDLGDMTLARAMSRRFLFACFLAVQAAAAVAAACSATTVAKPGDDGADASEEEAFVVPAEGGGGGACVLAVGTSRQICNDCLTKNCCTVVNACFSDPRCEAVNDCMNDCGARLGRTDAGADCVRACANADGEGAKKLLDMLECQTGRCRAPCQG